MFQGLRPNSIFYVLDKGENPSLKIGQVVSVSNPQPKFPTYTPGQFNPQPMETTVDVVVKLPNEQMEFKQLPSNMQIANSENLVVSESREAMDAEVEAMYRHSKEIVESEPYHKKVMEECAEPSAEYFRGYEHKIFWTFRWTRCEEYREGALTAQEYEGTEDSTLAHH